MSAGLRVLTFGPVKKPTPLLRAQNWLWNPNILDLLQLGSHRVFLPPSIYDLNTSWVVKPPMSHWGCLHLGRLAMTENYNKIGEYSDSLADKHTPVVAHLSLDSVCILHSVKPLLLHSSFLLHSTFMPRFCLIIPHGPYLSATSGHFSAPHSLAVKTAAAHCFSISSPTSSLAPFDLDLELCLVL